MEILHFIIGGVQDEHCIYKDDSLKAGPNTQPNWAGSGKVSDRIVSGHNIPRFCNWSITVLQHTCSDYSITNIINIL